MIAIQLFKHPIAQYVSEDGSIFKIFVYEAHEDGVKIEVRKGLVDD